MKVTVHLYTQSKPIVIEDVKNSYQKGNLFCVLQNSGTVAKFPFEHIFRVTEEEVTAAPVAKRTLLKS